MADPVSSAPRTVEEIYKDYTARRTGLIRALTSDVDEFYAFCNGNPEMQTLCLYGLPNGSWKVALPAENAPVDLLQPTLGIYFTKDMMKHHDWLSLVAMHSDAWLVSVAFFFATCLNGNGRKRLINLINDRPSVYETMVDLKQREDKSDVDNSGKSRHSTKRSDGKMNSRSVAVEDVYEDDEEHSETLCGTCSSPFLDQMRRL